MKKTILSILAAAAIATTAWAQASEQPYYLPGEGVYHVGMPGDMKPAVKEPTLVTQAYKLNLNVKNAELASARAGVESYNLLKYFNEDATQLNLVPFMGIGTAYGLIVRDMEGGSYQLGDYSPNKTWSNCRILAAFNRWQGHETFPLAVYDQWDCPLTYAADPMVGAGKNDAVTVDFGNPHEGLVVRDVNFSLITGSGNNSQRRLTVTLNIWDKDHETVTKTYSTNVNMLTLVPIGTVDGNNVYNVTAHVSEGDIVIDTPFDVTVSGFAGSGVNAWLPRAVDTHGIYPSHTTYSNGTASTKATDTDVCINVDGYFNYLGTWGWWDGKTERGEVVPSADLVQIYYDPSDADWPGAFFMGEAAFPVECTFGVDDIGLESKPSWINAVQLDDSQWDEYECVQVILSADALPEEETGRNGKVVLTTADKASRYTIYLRQGNAGFDYSDTDGINATTITIPAEGGCFDLMGRKVSDNSRGSILIKGGKKFISK